MGLSAPFLRQGTKTGAARTPRLLRLTTVCQPPQPFRSCKSRIRVVVCKNDSRTVAAPGPGFEDRLEPGPPGVGDGLLCRSRASRVSWCRGRLLVRGRLPSRLSSWRRARAARVRLRSRTRSVLRVRLALLLPARAPCDDSAGLAFLPRMCSEHSLASLLFGWNLRQCCKRSHRLLNCRSQWGHFFPHLHHPSPAAPLAPSLPFGPSLETCATEHNKSCTAGGSPSRPSSLASSKSGI